MKNFPTYIAIFSLIVLLPGVLFAAEGEFIPLVGLPYIGDGGGPKHFGEYVKALYYAAISIGAFLAVIKIIFAGVKYMLTDVVTTKGDAKKDIYGALIGLLIVVGAVLILQTINPRLLEIKLFNEAPILNITTESTTIDSGGRTPSSFCASLNSDGKTCVESVCSSNGWIAKLIQDDSYRVRSVQLNKCEELCNQLGGVYGKNSTFAAVTCAYDKEKYQELLNSNLENLAREKCPENKICEIKHCDQSRIGWTGGFRTDLEFNCSNQCISKESGVYYEPSTQACVIRVGEKIIKPITVDPAITYYQKQNEDEIAGDYPKQKLTILGTNSLNGLVLIRYEDGREVELACNYIVPSPCNN